MLWRGDRITFVGAGGPGHLPLVEQALRMRNASFGQIEAILLTHADVLLCANAYALRALGEARMYINRLEEPRLNLVFPPSQQRRAKTEKARAARIGGYRPCPVDFYVGDGDHIDAWYGLGVVALPGPTPGHCGYYCRHLDALFCGTSLEGRRRRPGPPYDEEALAVSRARVARLNPKWLFYLEGGGI